MRARQLAEAPQTYKSRRALELRLSFPTHAFRIHLKYSFISLFEPATRTFISCSLRSHLLKKNVRCPGKDNSQTGIPIHFSRISREASRGLRSTSLVFLVVDELIYFIKEKSAWIWKNIFLIVSSGKIYRLKFLPGLANIRTVRDGSMKKFGPSNDW